MSNKKAIVIGAGIAGLAMARALSLKGYTVSIFERSGFATGASVRNFGMIWPIGQPSGTYSLALRSRDIWKSLGEQKVFWYSQAGSLHLAYRHDEWKVLEELAEGFRKERKITLLSAEQVMQKSPAAVQQGLLGGLYSEDELIVDPREAIAGTATYLLEKHAVQFHWNTCITAIKGQSVYTSSAMRYDADVIVVCSGADFETLYPAEFIRLKITKCKLQMMRFTSQQGWNIGPALCGGLSLIHYKSFTIAPSLPSLQARYENEMSEYLRYGIHVMVSQNGAGELTVGDSHEYGLTTEPFDKQLINELIVKYLHTFARFKHPYVIQTWNGIYPKLPGNGSYLISEPEPGVFLFNGLGGSGMTMAFGLAEEFAKDF